MVGPTPAKITGHPAAREEYTLVASAYSFAGTGVRLATVDVAATASAMLAAAAAPLAPDARAELADWSAREYSLRAIAQQVVEESLGLIGR